MANSNPAKDNVYRKLKELSDSIGWDSFNLTRDQQEMLDNKLSEFRKSLDSTYFANSGE